MAAFRYGEEGGVMLSKRSISTQESGVMEIEILRLRLRMTQAWRRYGESEGYG